MAGNNSIKLSNLQTKTYGDSNDAIVAWSNTSNADVIIPVAALYTNTTLVANSFVLLDNHLPANSTANTTKGQIWSDGNYIYVASATNIIKRVALLSF